MNIKIQSEWYSLEQCSENPKTLYVFGDNTIRVGNGGQASIRSADNSIGIATKNLPKNTDNSYFSDLYEEYVVVSDDIEKVIKKYKDGGFTTLVLPYAKLGTGLSKMPEKSPKLYKWMNELISEVFNIDYNYKPII